ncbi:ESPR-type extended signal peptide-containing protein [Paraburkholderia sp. SARCC-3016]|uniref:YadA-like family protein n=1 Tax=Paraburkholderia sp. SARCC-3016 TaxID=3058611 RepID=UPI002809FD4A|nr:YadA-like family protein [Paraburkholderia sp. SARCC-3016]MDQ7978468.1 ESPR-type extended signal peptide-containing protein [Paraburkholderia sp. SARCC-3016]
MNRAYKSVWNESTGTYVAAAETARVAGKKSNRRARNIASAVVASAATFGAVGLAYAADTGVVPKVPANLASTNGTNGVSGAATPKPTNDWFCFLFFCGGADGGGNTTNITYNGVNAADAYAYTYDRNNLKYFHVNSSLSESSASGTDAISIGGGARANGAQNIALGGNALANGLNGAVALGGEAQATSAFASALGGQALASADSSTALGAHASALARNSVALGYESVSTRANTVSVGKQGAERQIVNVAAGSAGTDAVNVNQLNAAIASIDGGGSVTPPPPPDTTDLKFFHAKSALADSTAGGSESVAIGGNSTALAYNTVAIGSNSRADRANTVSIGSPGLERQLTNLAAGTNDTDAVNLKQLNTTVQSAITGGVPNLVQYDSSARTSLTLGGISASQPVTVKNLAAGAITQNSTDAVNGSQMFALAAATNQGFQDFGKGVGALAQSTAEALGGNANAQTADGSITPPSYTVAGKTYHNVGSAIDALATNGGGSASDAVKYDGSSHTKVTLGGTSAGAPVALTNLAAGAVTASSSDAVNGAQLYQASSSVAGALGGSSTVGADGRVSASYTLDGATYSNVGSALSAVNAKIGSGSANGVTYDTSAHDKVTLGGVDASMPVQLTNLASGRLEAGSKDAVNGSQLFATANSVAKVIGAGSTVQQDGTVTSPTFTISGTTYNDVGSAMNAIGAVGKDVQVTAKYVKVVSNASESMSLGSETTAIGGGAFAAGSRSLAIGTGARSQFDDAVAIGSGAQAYEANTVSFGHTGGEKRLTNVSAGINATDAATVGQLTALQQQLNRQNTGLKSMTLLGASAVTDYIAVSPNTTPGAATRASDDLNAMAVGPTSAATGPNALAVGAGAGALRTGSTAVGSKAGALAINATVVGVGATTGFDAKNSVAIGYLASAETEDTLALGTSSIANGTSSIAVGTNAVTWAAADNGVALGKGATVGASSAVALGAGSVADRANSVSVGNGTKQRQIVNVAAGTMRYDAVNVDQLKGVTTALGGGADVNADGTIKQPAYTVGTQTYSDVGSAIAAAAISGAGAADAVKYDTTARDKVTLGGTSATKRVTLANVADGKSDNDAVNVKQLKDLGASFDSGGNVNGGFVAYDDSTKQQVTLKGSGGTKITGLAAASLSAGSTDAVNGAQLFQTNQNVSNVAGNVTNLTNVVNNITNGGNGVKYFHANSTLADSSATGADTVAIGGNARATANGSVALGSNALADRANTVSVGAAGAERQIANLAAGTADTDAINLKQLKDMGASFDSTGGVTGSFVSYDDTSKTRVTLGGKTASVPVTVANVADGKANNDAVNVKQLKDMGASIDTSGHVTNAFVAYDDATRATITLKGTDGTKITRLAAGTLSASSTDAVNGSQLFETNQNVANVTGNVTNLTNVVNNITNGSGIKYFSANSTLDAATATGTDSIAIGGNARATSANSVALGSNALTVSNLNTPAYQPGSLELSGTTAIGEVSVGSVGKERRVTNVAAGAASTDAVNVSQLKSAVAASSSASLANSVLYDSTSHDAVTLGGTAAVATVALKNVGAGQIAAASRDAVNGSQLFNTATSAAAALGGGAIAGADGKIKAPAYNISGKTYNDVGSALAAVGYTVDTINSDVTSATKYISVAAPNDDPSVPEAKASGGSAVAVGSGALARADRSVSIGPGAATTEGKGSVAIGYSAVADRDGSMAFGSEAKARNADSIAFGKNAQALHDNSIAIGTGSMTDATNVVSFGNSTVQRRLTHVADGIDATDAATVGQLSALEKKVVKTAGVQSMLLGATKSVTDYIAVSSNTTPGVDTRASDDQNAMAVGPSSAATGPNALAVGAAAGALRTASTAVGAKAGALGVNTTAIGASATTGFDAENSVAIGYLAAAESKDTLALGSSTVASKPGAVALGAGSQADRVNVISVGSAALQRQIVNVAAGTGNYDAVNVSQLQGVLAALGGSAGLDASGAVKKPTYTLDGQTYTDVGSAIAKAATMGSGDVVSDAEAVKYDTTSHNRVTLGGTSASAPVTLTNLAAGAVSVSSGDAINGAQLYGTADSIASALGGGAAVGADGKVSKPKYSVNGKTYNNVGSAFDEVNAYIASSDVGPNVNPVVYDTSARDKVTLGGVNGSPPVTLGNVADAKTDLEAVNLKQLKAAGLNVDPNGVVTNSFVAYDNASKASVTFNAGGSPTQLKNVADAVDPFDAVNLGQMQSYVTTYVTDRIDTNNNNSGPRTNDLPTGSATGTDAIAIGNGSIASGTAAIAIGARTVTGGDQSVALGVQASAPATNAVALGANSVADRDNTVSVGAAGAERQITNVAAGSAPTDAVNVGQLSGAVNGIQSRLNDMDRDNRRGIAAASALNIVTPYLPGRTTLNAGVAGYRGTAALGLGVSRWNEKGTINYNLGVSSAGGNSTIVRAGVGIVFGN